MKAFTNPLKEHKGFIVFILLMSVFRSAIADWYHVPSASMKPSIEIGDQVVVDKMAYDLRLPFTSHSLMQTGQPERGDIIVFDSKAADIRLIKRVIGIPGDTVSMHNEKLFINNKPVNYRLQDSSNKQNIIANETLGNINHRVKFDLTSEPERANFDMVEVPAGHYLVLGDNRRNSADSRVYGFVPHSEIKGRAHSVAFSLNHGNYYLPKPNRFLTALN